MTQMLMVSIYLTDLCEMKHSWILNWHIWAHGSFYMSLYGWAFGGVCLHCLTGHSRSVLEGVSVSWLKLATEECLIPRIVVLL